MTSKPATTEPPLLVSTREATRLLGVNYRTLHQLRHEGRIQARRTRNERGAWWRWVRSSLVRYAEEGDS